MTTTDAVPDTPTEQSTAPRLASGVATMVGSSFANQTGAAIGAMAFTSLGTVGVVAVRQMITAVVLGSTIRPRFRTMSGAQLRPVLGLAFVFGSMNVCLYTAIERIGLGLAVTLEFLGPLVVALVATRSAVNVVCAGAAAVGVVVLTAPGPSTDYVGIGLALLAAAGWASYILLNRVAGQRVPGVRGASAASVVSAVAWLPIAGFWFAHHPPSLTGVALAVTCGLLASVVPFAADIVALRRVPVGLFGTLASLNPVWAAVCGAVFLAETLQLRQWSAICVIVASNVCVTGVSVARTRRAVD